VLLTCAVHASYGLECDQNQNGQSMSFFKTSGDLSLIGRCCRENNNNNNILIVRHLTASVYLTCFRLLRRLRREMFGANADGHSFDGNGSHRGPNIEFYSLHSRRYVG